MDREHEGKNGKPVRLGALAENIRPNEMIEPATGFLMESCATAW